MSNIRISQPKSLFGTRLYCNDVIMLKYLFPKLAAIIPEGGVKNLIRRSILHFRTGIPRELMINRGDTVVQVGMWRSESARRLAEAVGSDGRIVLIEMSAEAAARISSTFSEMKYNNATVVNAGVWSEPDEVNIVHSESPSANRIDTGRLHPEGHGSSEGPTGHVKVETIENICSVCGVESVDYMEITVNGAELEAIRGMGVMLQRTKRLWVAGLTRDAVTGEPLNLEIAKELRRNGFHTKISRAKRQSLSVWGKIDGHVYAWRPN